MAVKDVIFEAKLKLDTRSSRLTELKSEIEGLNRTLRTAEEGSEKYRKAQFRLKEINNELTNSFSKTEKRVDGFGSKLGKLGNLVGIAGGALVLQQFGRAAFTAVADFDQAMANLSAITGATGKDLEFFEQQAKNIGESTSLSAVQAVQAFELIGSAKPELLKNKEALAQVTQEAVALAEAAGLELPIAAQALAGTLNQFSLAGDQSSRVINALAAGAKEGASAIPETSQAIDRFGTVAAAANVSVEQSVGLVQTLAEKNLKGAEAGTQLRNIILTLQAANIGYVNGQFDVNAALEELASKNLTAAESAKLFGRESVVAGQILIENRDQLEKYTNAVTDTNVAYEQQAIRTNTVKGATDRLRSAFEGLLLRLSGTSGIIRRSIDFLARNLENVAKAIGITVIGVVAYKVAVKAASTATKLYSTVTKALSVAKAFLTGGINGATGAMKAFNTATKANIIGLVVSLLATAVTAFLAFRDSANKAAKAQRNLNEAQQEALDTKGRVQQLIDQVKIAKNLDETQVANLKSRIDQEINLLKERQAEVLALEEKTKLEAAKIEQDRLNEIEKLREKKSKTTSASESRRLALQIQALEAQKSIQNQILNQETGFLKGEIESLIEKLETAKGGLKATSRDSASKEIKDSIAELEKSLSKAKQELNELSSTDAVGITKQIKKIEEAQKALEEAKERVFGKEKKGREDTRLQELAEEERFYIEKIKLAGASEEEILIQQQFYAERRKLILIAQQKEQKLEYQKLLNDIELLELKQVEARKKLLQEYQSEEERHQLALLDIHGATELAKLELTRKFENERLQTLKEGTLEYEKQQNKVAELDARINESRRDETRSALNELVAASQNAAQVITDAQIAAVDAQINAQQSRIEQARALAEKGNADILEQEEKRLDELQKKREKFVRAQQALAAVELIANSLVAISKAAAEGGAAAPFTIAATLISLTAGLIAARQTAQNAVSFRKGGSADWSELSGYTGSGNPNKQSTNLGRKPYNYEYEEYIFPEDVVKIGRNKQWFEKIRKGKIDLDKLPMASLRGKHSITPAFTEMVNRAIQMNVELQAGGVSSSEIKALRDDLKRGLGELRAEIRDQPKSSLSITERGIEQIIETSEYKRTRIKKIQ